MSSCRTKVLSVPRDLIFSGITSFMGDINLNNIVKIYIFFYVILASLIMGKKNKNTLFGICYLKQLFWEKREKNTA